MNADRPGRPLMTDPRVVTITFRTTLDFKAKLEKSRAGTSNALGVEITTGQEVMRLVSKALKDEGK